MKKTLWSGTVDNQDLSGMPNGDKQPMRVVEDADGRLMTEFARAVEEDGRIVYSESEWISDYQMRFRDMQPLPDEALRSRMISSGLLDA